MIYRRIQKLCKEKGISIRELERKAGISNATVIKWSTCSPTVDKLQAVAAVLEVTVDELLREEPEGGE